MQEEIKQDMTVENKDSATPIIEEKVFATIDDFMKIEIKVGTVLSVSVVEGADKLYILSVDMGKKNHVKFFRVFASLHNRKNYWVSNFHLLLTLHHACFVGMSHKE